MNHYRLSLVFAVSVITLFSISMGSSQAQSLEGAPLNSDWRVVSSGMSDFYLASVPQRPVPQTKEKIALRKRALHEALKEDLVAKDVMYMAFKAFKKNPFVVHSHFHSKIYRLYVNTGHSTYREYLNGAISLDEYLAPMNVVYAAADKY